MVLSEEKRAKLTDILARLRGISRDVGNSRHHALASATVASPPTPFIPGVGVPLHFLTRVKLMEIKIKTKWRPIFKDKKR